MKSVDDIPWIDSIPEDWNIYPIFHYFDENKKKNIGMIENNLLSLSYGKIIQKDIETNFGLLPESFETYQVLEDGYIVLRLTDLQNDKRSLRVGLVTQDGIITSAYVGLKKKRKIYSRYIYQLLHSYDLQKVFYNLGGGLRQSLRYEELKRLPILIPDYDTQKQIADFLDKETTRIDTLISKKQKQIELLQEKRQAIITQSVTKGLNPDVKMKDSGVEWIGEIPEHWEVRRLKFCIEGNLKYGANESAEDDNPENPRYIRITDFGDDGKLKNDTFKSLDPEIAKDYLLKNGDVLFARSGATVGKTFIYRESVGKSCFAGYLIKASSKRDLLEPEFLYLYTNSNSYLNWKNSIFIQATIQNIGADKYSNLQIPLPPIVEQNIILKKVLSETNRAELLIDKLIQSIDLLKEYRSSLITHAVSGQIDISKYEVSK